MIGQKIFMEADQESFAALSGDRNPIHMDKVQARRTQAGAPIVHGVHNVLMALEFFARRQDAPEIATLKASFSRMVHPGEEITYSLTASAASTATIEMRADHGLAARLTLTFGPPRPPAYWPAPDQKPAAPPEAAQELSFADMQGRAGCCAPPAGLAEAAAHFPAACRAWGSLRILGLLASTLLVGMICPGLHSIYGGFTLHAGPLDQPPGRLAYQVTLADSGHRVVNMQVAGSGIWGTINSFARMPPVAQPGLAELAGLVRPGEFAGSTALIIGGSRGLGELTAKILACGGADLIITYATGKADAEAVAAAISQAGGHCTVLPYDYRAPAAPQLATLPATPSQLYYFATGPIARRKSALFAPESLAGFTACYVSGFYEAFATLHAAAPHGLAAFYPSTVFIETRPRGMAEYAMAKAAGEILCAELNANLPKARILASRLPRLPTDQTAGITQAATEEPVAIMLPLIRQVQANWPR